VHFNGRHRRSPLLKDWVKSMSKVLPVLAALAFLMTGLGTPTLAQNACRHYPNGKCPPPKPHSTKPVKRTPAKAKPSYSREDFTPQQRELFLEHARQLCKKKFGAEANVYRLDYSKMLVTCTNNTR
jgi:hypothetical protein